MTRRFIARLIIVVWAAVAALYVIGCSDATKPDDCEAPKPSAILGEQGDTLLKGTIVLCGGSTFA